MKYYRCLNHLIMDEKIKARYIDPMVDWSSTEGSYNGYAYYVYFSSGNTSDNSKNDTYSVRAVRDL